MAVCPYCGARNNDEATFCLSCGAKLLSSAAPDASRRDLGSAKRQPPSQPAEGRSNIAMPQMQPESGAGPAPQGQSSRDMAGNAPQPQDAAAPVSQQSAPAPVRQHALMASFRSSAELGPHTAVLLACVLIVAVTLFLPWVSEPWIENSRSLITALDTNGSLDSDAIDLVASAVPALFRNSYSIPDLHRYADTLAKCADYLDSYVAQMATYGYVSDLTTVQGIIESLRMMATLLNVLFALWILVCLLLVAGLVVLFVRRNEAVLFAGLCVSALFSLAVIVGVLGINALCGDAIRQNLGASNLALSASVLSALASSMLAPALPCILLFVASLAGAVAPRILKDKPATPSSPAAMPGALTGH